MKLYASPLQGFTEAPWRNIHHELFGGIDAYYTPFVRVEKGEFRNKDIRDIEKENNKVTCLIPQLIASTPAELEKLVGLFLERGYREADQHGLSVSAAYHAAQGLRYFALSVRG